MPQIYGAFGNGLLSLYYFCTWISPKIFGVSLSTFPKRPLSQAMENGEQFNLRTYSSWGEKSTYNTWDMSHHILKPAVAPF